MLKIFQKKKLSKYASVHGILWDVLEDIGNGYYMCISVSPQHIRNVVVIKIEKDMFDASKNV